MNHFDYTGQCGAGAQISGTLEAIDGAEAKTQLDSMGLRNIDLREAKRAPIRRPLGNEDFIFFNEQLAALANTGICLDAGLRQLGKDIQSRRLRTVLSAVADDVERGIPIDEAIQSRAPQMPALYSRVVRAGVESGDLPAALFNLSHHLRLVAETRRVMAEALTYPAIVLVLAIVVQSAVIMTVVPMFGQILGDFDVSQPNLTTAVMAFGRIFPTLLIVLTIIVVGLTFLFFMLRFSPTGRSIRERIILLIPLIGPLIGDSLRARFLRAMAFSVNSGLPLPEALRLSADATASLEMSKEAECVASQVEQGTSVYKACCSTALIPAMFGYVVDTSGDRGNLREALVQLSKAYESRAVHKQSLLRGWVAPLAIVGVGFVIGILVLALFLPLTSLMNFMQSVCG